MSGAPARVLVVEDETDVRELMFLHLKRQGYEVTGVEDGEKAQSLLSKKGAYDLVILDWMLPGVSGLKICKQFKSEDPNQTPVLMVTARADTSDIVRGLEEGADDYITKPFELPVFLARVAALLRRSFQKSSLSNPNKFRIGELEVDAEAHQAFCCGSEIHLTLSEFKLLHALMQNQGRVLSREKLIDLVQGEGVSVVDRAIDTHVFGLRKKLGTCADFIETIRGVGYRVK